MGKSEQRCRRLPGVEPALEPSQCDRRRRAGERERLATTANRGRQEAAAVRHQNEDGVVRRLLERLQKGVGSRTGHGLRGDDDDHFAHSTACGQRHTPADLANLLDPDQLPVLQCFDRVPIRVEPGRCEVTGPTGAASALFRRRQAQQSPGQSPGEAPFAYPGRTAQEQGVRKSIAGRGGPDAFPVLLVPGQSIVHSMRGDIARRMAAAVSAGQALASIMR